MNIFERIRQGIVRKLLRDPAGYGRPVPKEALDGEYRSGAWDHFFGMDELPRNLVIAGLVHHLFPDSPAILDVGCGNGRLASVFRAYPFARYLGADVSSEGISRARALKLDGVEFTEGNYETWRPNETFDAIIFNECIGYASDPAATLSAFSAYLKPGGRFFLSHFRYGNYQAQWRRMANVCSTTYATAVMCTEGRQTWDIKILEPLTRQNTPAT